MNLDAVRGDGRLRVFDADNTDAWVDVAVDDLEADPDARTQ